MSSAEIESSLCELRRNRRLQRVARQLFLRFLAREGVRFDPQSKEYLFTMIFDPHEKMCALYVVVDIHRQCRGACFAHGFAPPVRRYYIYAPEFFHRDAEPYMGGTCNGFIRKRLNAMLLDELLRRKKQAESNPLPPFDHYCNYYARPHRVQ